MKGFPKCIAVSIFLVATSVPVCLSAKEAVFPEKPFIIKQHHGESIAVVRVSEEDDVNGGVIYVYKTASGSSGFVSPSNVANIDELKYALDPQPVVKESTRSENPQRYNSTSDTSSVSSSAAAIPTNIDPDILVSLLNQMYGNVCRAEIKGIFSKTLKIDWTGNTVKLHAMKVLGEVGSIKDQLYLGGIRYFQFPNDAGTYNVIDWKTGEKKSISDRAPYYFNN